MTSTPKGREAKLDLRLGRLAVAKGRITRAQLDEALAEQARGVQRGRKKPRPLGVILAEKRFLTDAQVRELLEEQEARLLAEERRQREDRLLGRILVDGALVDAARVEECLQAQSRAIEEGEDPPPPLGELLIRKGYASDTDIEQALDLQTKVRLTCASCGKDCAIEDLNVESMDRCPSCGGPLEAQASEPEPEPEPPPPPPAPPPPEPAPAPDLGTISHYQVLRKIGEGGVGAVYEALDTQLNRKVALKILRSDLREGAGAGEKEVRRFVREAQLAANLPKHPHIVAVYEIGDQDGCHFIAMELIQGRTFDQWKRASAPPLRTQIRVLRDVALAVHHAHDHGTLHRDLKPGNILIDGHEKPYVVDFGIARPVKLKPGDPGLSGVIAGTASYISLEQAEGVPDLDARTDVYSMGAILYEILSGRTPHTGGSREEVLEKLRADPPPPGGFARSRPFSTVDTAVERICLKAIARDRAQRTPSARAFADELTQWLESREKARAAGSRRPRKVLLIAGGALAVTILILVLVLALRPSGPDFQKDLRRARTLADSGRIEQALSEYERILVVAPALPAARDGRDEMRRRLMSDAVKEADAALSAVDAARARVAENAKALQEATLSNEGRLRDEQQAAKAQVREAEERLRAARERLKTLAESGAR